MSAKFVFITLVLVSSKVFAEPPLDFEEDEAPVFKEFDKNEDDAAEPEPTEAVESVIEGAEVEHHQSEKKSSQILPMTVISRAMLKSSGVRTLKEALVLYVPGFTDIEARAESNFSYRGLYSESQRKVLILLDGHPMNSGSYLAAPADFGIAVHQLEKIEVFRGPSSFRFGRGAFAATVNLVSIAGESLNGKSQVELAGGNHGQRRVRLLSGRGDSDGDFLIWGQYYRSAGESIDLEGQEKYNEGKSGEVFIDGVDQPPAHDFGFNYRSGRVSFYGASRQSSRIAPYASSDMPYTYSDYRQFAESGPGFAAETQSLGMKFQIPGGMTIHPYYNHFAFRDVRVTIPSSQDGLAMQWFEETIGLISEWSNSHKLWGQDGEIVIGAQVDAFQVRDSIMLSLSGGDISDVADSQSTPLLKAGGEEVYSGYFGASQSLGAGLVLSTHHRFDSINRRTGQNYLLYSPQAGLNWEVATGHSLFLSYSQAFVDSPYWYRYNALALYGGAEISEPEIITSTQLQWQWNPESSPFEASSTIYYQQAENLLENDESAAGTNQDPRILNSGQRKSYGVEAELAWLKDDYQLRLNIQWYKALEPERGFLLISDKVAHVPQFSGNLIADYFMNNDFSLNMELQLLGEQFFVASGVMEERVVDPALLVNLGARHENIGWEGLYVDLRVYNVGGIVHYQGGQSLTQIPYRQPGRWWLASLGLVF